MKPSTFAELLHQALDSSEQRHDRQIIRFTTMRDFRICTQQLAERCSSLPTLRQVQPFPLIQALACPLKLDNHLKALPFIESIETDNRIQVHGLRSASMPASKPFPGLARIPWGIKHIRAPLTWNKTMGERVHIGVIDTGVDFSHPDLRHCLSRGINIMNRQMLPSDDNGHGTHIAGTIAAYTEDDGLLGVAPLAIIHPVKAFDHLGSAFVSDIISGIEWCVQNRMNIINMSFGMKSYSKALEAAIRSANKAGIVIVASSGNEGKQADIDYPAKFRQVIAVGATTRKGSIASFSNISRQIDIYAPGEKILSTWLRGKYQKLSGTSMATSHISGVVALILAKRPQLKPISVKTILTKHARLILTKKDAGSGAKEIDSYRAVTAALRSGVKKRV